MKMKKIFSKALTAGIMSAVLLAGCGNSAADNANNAGSVSEGQNNDDTQKDSGSSDQLAKIKEKGEIVIAMEGTWAPWTYHDEDGELVGYDVEVGKMIADKLGVKATFVEGEWDGLFAGLDSERYDIIINGVEVTDERSQKYDFTDPYCYIHTVLITKDDNTDIKTFEDLKDKTTANSISSTYMMLAEQYGATVQGVDSLDETLQMVLSGRADATLNADVSFYDYMNVHPEAPLKVVATTDEASLVSIPMRKGDDSASLRDAVNSAISELGKSGELSAASEKYFGADISKE
jgi:cystine transport system substrate-binding protein